MTLRQLIASLNSPGFYKMLDWPVRIRTGNTSYDAMEPLIPPTRNEVLIGLSPRLEYACEHHREVGPPFCPAVGCGARVVFER